ncbi:MAG: ferredoxin [Polaromonas sp.]|nr:ferredoxin [Polaromonas sp.]
MPPPLRPTSSAPHQAIPACPSEAVFHAAIQPGGAVFDAPASLSLLQAAEQAGLSLLDSSCRNGTCRTCICQLVSGQVRYRIEWPGLSLDEKHEGYILPCVAHAASDVVIKLPS